MNPGCWLCLHYCQRSYLFTTGQRNVSGGIAWYQVWSKHRCNLEQEDKCPNHCDYELNQKKMDELNKKYPDLALTRKKIEVAEKSFLELKGRMMSACTHK